MRLNLRPFDERTKSTKNLFHESKQTERECVTDTIRMAKAEGYRDLGAVIAEGGKLSPGDKVYAQIMEKCIALVHVGTAPVEEGLNILELILIHPEWI